MAAQSPTRTPTIGEPRSPRDLLGDALATIEAEVGTRTKPLTHDRRAFPRHKGTCVVTVAPIENDEFHSDTERAWLLHSSRTRGLMADISRKSVAFFSDEVIHGESLIVRVFNFRVGSRLDTTGKILRSEQADGGRFKTVVLFDSPISDDQVLALGR